MTEHEQILLHQSCAVSEKETEPLRFFVPFSGSQHLFERKKNRGEENETQVICH